MKFSEIDDIELPTNEELRSLPLSKQIVAFWPILRLLATVAKIFTGKKADQKLNQLIAWGDALSAITLLTDGKVNDNTEAPA